MYSDPAPSPPGASSAPWPAAPAGSLRGSSMHDGVAARLRAMIFERELPPGALVDEKLLAERWQISRTPLREALKVLVAEGLLELLPRQGCRVIEMRQPVERLHARLAVLELQPGDAGIRSLQIDAHHVPHRQLQHFAQQRADRAARRNHQYPLDVGGNQLIQATANALLERSPALGRIVDTAFRPQWQRLAHQHQI